MAYNHHEIEEKWQKRWSEDSLYSVDVNKMDEKYYVLVMFPYPSGDRLHMGHWYQYGVMDTWTRYQRMNGKNVFFPMGFDAFGLPAENFAIKHGIHPKESTTKNADYMMTQFKKMGVSYNFDYALDTSKEDYYKWTQWVFLELFKNDLAYKKEAPVNWCTSCQTVLANEQVKDGVCERCESVILQKNLNQWFLKITDYAEPLLANLETLDWPHKTLAMQKHWIGKSIGSEIEFKVDKFDIDFKVFTTRPDTLFGCTYVTFAPEHPKVLEFVSDGQKQEVLDYIEKTKKTSELERLTVDDEKTGVFTGAYAINPINQEKVPIWISDYVLFSYGTGAVMAVPAHDERDFDFAKAFDLPIKQVIVKDDESSLDKAFTGTGLMINSGKFDSMKSTDVKKLITEDLQKQNKGESKINFRLRDWLISRQRYWGAPIPIIHCDDCGPIAVPQEQLPIILPEDVEFKPMGESPLKACDSFMNVKCPKCKKPALREADTLDTFMCSSWYYLRFPNVGNNEQAFEKGITDKMMPVDKYVGGPEHACMHLLYARFINMVMKDLGYTKHIEPFTSLTHQGMILGSDGQKMSKSKGNSVSPDGYVEDYGSDVLRLYLCFGFSYIDGGPWDDSGIRSMAKFVDRVARLLDENKDLLSQKLELDDNYNSDEKKLLYVYNHSLKGVTVDVAKFQFNTSIARVMELYNALNDYLKNVSPDKHNKSLVSYILKNMIIILSPFIPHICEEWWEAIGEKSSVSLETWPTVNEKYLELDEIQMAVMINGKVREQMKVAKDSSDDVVFDKALESKKIQGYLEGMTVIKKIHVKGKLLNLILKKA
ncbi:MAG: leucine--tRNA ligase [Candidatus Cloacimonadota bacterium]|nr:MAG: leucine--tRNA ligase [Candidatus Cloacimonadota bacterium]